MSICKRALGVGRHTRHLSTPIRKQRSYRSVSPLKRISRSAVTGVMGKSEPKRQSSDSHDRLRGASSHKRPSTAGPSSAQSSTSTPSKRSQCDYCYTVREEARSAGASTTHLTRCNGKLRCNVCSSFDPPRQCERTLPRFKGCRTRKCDRCYVKGRECSVCATGVDCQTCMSGMWNCTWETSQGRLTPASSRKVYPTWDTSHPTQSLPEGWALLPVQPSLEAEVSPHTQGADTTFFQQSATHAPSVEPWMLESSPPAPPFAHQGTFVQAPGSVFPSPPPFKRSAAGRRAND